MEFNGITYNNVKVNQGLALSTGPINIAGLVGTDPDDGTGIINAIDIDWNGAELESLIKNKTVKNKLSNLTINTTSDLLKLIVELINAINVNTELYWFSYGTEEITVDNYTTANNAEQIEEYPNEIIYIPTQRSYLYILVKSNMDVQVIDSATNSPAYLSEYSIISGYKIVKPNSKIGAKVFIRINEGSDEIEPVEPEPEPEPEIINYYFSIGEEEVNIDNYTTANNAIETTEFDSQYEYTLSTRKYLYILIKEDKNVEIIDSVFNLPIYNSELTDVNIRGHKVIKTNGKVYGKIIINIL